MPTTQSTGAQDGGAVALATRTQATETTITRAAPSPALRVAAWILTFNASYWLVFVFPIVLIRQFEGHHSLVVP